MAKLPREVQDRDLVILKVSIKEEREALEKYQEEFHIPFPILIDDRAKVANRYGVWAHPVTFFINREGKIIGRVYGGRDWVSSWMRDFIQDLLKEKT